MTWEDLLVASKTDESYIEYLDADEESVSMVAIEPKRLWEESKLIKKYKTL